MLVGRRKDKVGRVKYSTEEERAVDITGEIVIRNIYYYICLAPQEHQINTYSYYDYILRTDM